MFNKLREKSKIIIYNFKLKLKELMTEIGALYLAYKRGDVPWYTKLVIVIVVGYAISPIDLIPDFIPVLGYLDDLLLLPLGIALAIRLIPKDILKDCREKAKNIFKDEIPKNWFIPSIIILSWSLVFIYIIVKLFKI